MTDQEDYEQATVYDQENDPDWPEPNPEPAEEPSHPETTSDDTETEPSTDPEP